MYIHDTLKLFGSRLSELRTEWQLHLAPHIPSRTLKTLARKAKTLNVELSDDIRRASRISPERRLTPEAIREACAYGLEQLIS